MRTDWMAGWLAGWVDAFFSHALVTSSFGSRWYWIFVFRFRSNRTRIQFLHHLNSFILFFFSIQLLFFLSLLLLLLLFRFYYLNNWLMNFFFVRKKDVSGWIFQCMWRKKIQRKLTNQNWCRINEKVHFIVLWLDLTWLVDWFKKNEDTHEH